MQLHPSIHPSIFFFRFIRGQAAGASLSKEAQRPEDMMSYTN